MQDEVLDASGVRIYAIWIPMVSGDDRTAAVASSAILRHDRVVQAWDGERAAGKWLHEHVVAGRGDFARRSPFRRRIVWDAYFYYGPDARWGDEGPIGLLARGAPVVHETEPLLKEIRR